MKKIINQMIEILLIQLWHNFNPHGILSLPHNLVLVCVRGKISNCDVLCHGAILNTESTVWVYLNKRVRTFIGTSQYSTSDCFPVH